MGANETIEILESRKWSQDVRGGAYMWERKWQLNRQQCHVLPPRTRSEKQLSWRTSTLN